MCLPAILGVSLLRLPFSLISQFTRLCPRLVDRSRSRLDGPHRPPVSRIRIRYWLRYPIPTIATQNIPTMTAAHQDVMPKARRIRASSAKNSPTHVATVKVVTQRTNRYVQGPACRQTNIGRAQCTQNQAYPTASTRSRISLTSVRGVAGKFTGPRAESSEHCRGLAAAGRPPLGANLAVD